MKTCPHCQFLVVDDATSCGVCKQPLAVPQQPSGPWGAEPVPGFGDTPPLPSGGVATRQRRSARGARSGQSRWRIGAGAAGSLFAMLMVSIFLGVGRSTTIDVTEEDWTAYRDPSGAFSIQLPGPAAPTSEVTPVAGVGDVGTTGATWDDGAVATGVVRYEIPPGTPFDLAAGLQGFASGAFDAPEIVNQAPTETPFGPGIDGKILAGDPKTGLPVVAYMRIILASGVPYVFITVSEADQQAAASDVQQRLVASFATPAA